VLKKVQEIKQLAKKDSKKLKKIKIRHLWVKNNEN
jgi:hypothetical protein